MFAIMIEKAANWDLVNPWLDKGLSSRPVQATQAGVMH
mgnify:CR=1 FL=1